MRTVSASTAETMKRVAKHFRTGSNSRRQTKQKTNWRRQIQMLLVTTKNYNKKKIDHELLMSIK